MTIAETLRAAAAIVRQGWTQGQVSDEGWQNVCAYGALGLASGHQQNGKWFGSAWDNADLVASFVERVLFMPATEMTRALASWNDAKGQTAENVAIGLELAAVLWEQEHACEVIEAQAQLMRA